MATTLKAQAQIDGRISPVVSRRMIVLGGLLLLVIGLFLLNVATGSVNIPLDNVVRILTGGTADKATWSTIVLKFRLPKALTAVLAGAALGVSGLQMQTLFRNPLADPFLLGISSGASLGVALVILGGGVLGATLIKGLGVLHSFQLIGAASLGAFLVMSMVLLVSRRISNTMTLLILGLMFGYLTSALVSLLIYFAITERVQAFIAWSFGSFGDVTWTQMQVLAPVVIVGLVLAHCLSKPLNALLLGENYARSMGVEVTQARFGIILSASLLAGSITAFCGPIGFLGVAVPHLCRGLMNTSDHRMLVPGTMLMGAALALFTDFVAQMPGTNMILPLNAVTALIGAPIVAWVILRQRNLRAAFAG